MKARPILFSAPMIRALLAGTKTQTRRLVKPQPSGHHWAALPSRADYSGGYRNLHSDVWQFEHRIALNPQPDRDRWIRCPYGAAGDLLWVRETTVRVEEHGYLGPVYAASEQGAAMLDWGIGPAPDDVRDVEPEDVRLRPAIHMPRKYSRLTLRITDVRVQRLKDIDGLDAIAEGITREEGVAPWRSYLRLWNEINGEGAWQTNPWVWALSFEVIKANVDQVLAQAA